jgi:hypothetical protein
MRADPDGPGLREPTIRIVIDRLVSVEFTPRDDTEPFLKLEGSSDQVAAVRTIDPADLVDSRAATYVSPPAAP